MELQRRFFDMLQESQYWPLEDMRRHQRDQLKQLLEHARANTEFFRTRLDPIFKPSGEIDWDRWREIPIMTRNDIYEKRHLMLAKNVPPGHGETKDLSNSGSSGPPVTVTFNGLAAIASQATIFRAQKWHSVDYAKDCLSWTVGGFGANERKVDSSGPWGPVWEEASHKGQNFPFIRPNKTENILDFLVNNDIGYLRTRPRSAQELAITAMRRGDKLKFDRIFTLGAAIPDDARVDCREAFGCEMTAIYSANEASSIAYQCPTGNHFHINAEIVLCEILNADDEPCQPGEMGRVVVTPFYYTAQPIIRYDLGDLAVPGETCTCGRHLPVIRKIVGRVTHMFRFPDGSVVSPTVPERAMDILQCRQWQFVQVGPLAVEVRYVPRDWNETGDEDAMADIVRNNTHADVTVSYTRLREIKPNAGGKFIEYKSELAQSN